MLSSYWPRSRAYGGTGSAASPGVHVDGEHPVIDVEGRADRDHVVDLVGDERRQAEEADLARPVVAPPPERAREAALGPFDAYARRRVGAEAEDETVGDGLVISEHAAQIVADLALGVDERRRAGRAWNVQPVRARRHEVGPVQARGTWS